MRSLAELFAVIADPTRLAVLVLLQRHGECCVCEIQAILGVSQSRASRHLKALRVAGLLEDRRVGTWAHYRTPDAPPPAQRILLETVAAIVTPAQRAPIDGRVATYRQAKRDACGPPAGAHPAPLPEGV